MRALITALTLVLLPAPLWAEPAPQLTVREIRYEGNLTENEARFAVNLDLETTGKGEVTLPLFEGDVAVLTTELPANLRLAREGTQYKLIVERAGRYQFKLELVAKIARAEPWNSISFTGPAAAIGEVTAAAKGAGVEVQLLTGTLQSTETKADVTQVRGFLGPDRVVSVRWQSRAAEVTRKAVLTCETIATIQVTPTVVKYKTDLKFEILQGAAAKLVLTLPVTQALTKLQGEGVRDWQIKPEGGQQTLTVEFIKPVEKTYALTLLSEQTVESATASVAIAPPQPQAVERESGSLTVSAEDVLVTTDSANGLRQVNAATGALAAYQFYARPFVLNLKLRRLEPVVKVADRVIVRTEEARLLVSHALTLNVEKAGIYVLELLPQKDFVVVDVKGEGVEDWKVTGGKLVVNFSSRLLGDRKLDVQLERPITVAAEAEPEIGNLVVEPLRVVSAVKETTQIGAAAAPGLQLKTATDGLTGLREMPITRLPQRSDEVLAYYAEQPDWRLTLAAERLAARLTADVFNLITIGDGLLGGSATIRFAILNQGVQEFRITVPKLWKNVEFTGPNIRRKELQDETWTIGLQEKVWGGYALVLTYDYQFDPHKATLPIGGIHPEGVERETGSIAITSAANLQLAAQLNGDTIRRVDETELSASDRALITRPVLLAYRYTGEKYGLSVDVTRYEELPVLDAAADRTQLTTVLTEAGQMLTQASFMVKNNDRQFQTFTLPAGADFWACYVRGEPAKPEKSGDKLLVPLPRGLNRDEAFGVDIVYAQKIDSLKSLTPRKVALAAPETDMQTTYAEWELYVPKDYRLAGFGGNMIVARGTTYGLRDAWREFLRFYDALYREGAGLLWAFVILIGLAFLVVYAIRRGWRGLIAVGTVVVIGLVLAAMMLPALNSSREKARRVSCMSNLRQIGAALSTWADQHGGQLPGKLDQIKGMVGGENVLIDPESGAHFQYAGEGRKWQDEGGNAIIAYSPDDRNGRNVLFSNGSVRWVHRGEFEEGLERDDWDVGREVAGKEAGVDLFVAEPKAEAGKPVAPAEPPAPTTRPARTTAPAKPPSAGASELGVRYHGVDKGVSVGVPVAPMVAGIRPIRIDIPRTGTRFVFTKVLNVSEEPLAVRALAMEQEVFAAVRAAGQTLAFLIGLALTWWQWRRTRPSSLLLALGLALAVGSVVSLMVSFRLLHAAMIAAVPVVALAIFVWLARRLWRKRPASDDDDTGPATPVPPPIPPVVTTLVMVALLHATIAGAAEPAAKKPVAKDPKKPVATAVAAPMPVSILSATYTGTVRALDPRETARVAEIEAVLELDAVQPDQKLALFGEDVAVQEFEAPRQGWGWFKSADAKLVRDGKTVSVQLRRAGRTTVRLKFLVKLTGDVAKRQLALAIPAALTSRVTVTLDEAEAAVDAPHAVSLKTTPDGQGTRVEAVFGAADRVEFSWTPRMKRAAEIAATVFSQNTALVTFAGGAANVRSVIDYQVTQGELRQMQVKLPAGQRLMRVEGDSIRTWKLDGQTLQVELVKGVTPSYRLTVETEKVQDAPPTTVSIDTPHALDVKRETGVVALRTSEEFSLSVEQAAGMQKVDVEEFARAMQVKTAEKVSTAYRFLKPEFTLSVRVEPVQPQVEAQVRNHARVTTDQITLQATVEYTIKRAGVFTLRVAVPDGYRVDNVTGANLAQWVEKKDEKLVEVTLKQRVSGTYALQVHLTQFLRELPKSVTIVGVHPLGTEKLTGFVMVTAEEGVQIKTDAFSGLTEVPAASVVPAGTAAPQGGALAFKLLPTEVGIVEPVWKLAVSTERIESWVRAEVMNLLTVSETLINGQSQVRFEIANAPTKEFRVRVPATFKNVEVTGANIRRKDHDETSGEWRVELQTKVRGTYVLTVTWDLPWNVKDGALEFSGIEALGVERETGALAVVAPPRLRVEAKTTTTDLLKVDAQDLPDWAERTSEPPVLTYRYLRPGYRLTLDGQRFEEAEVLQALVDNVQLTTVVSEDGQMMTEMALAVRNNARQYLEVNLPQGAQVWSAFVAGQPVRPSKREGKLLLPMERSTGDATVPVEITYVGSGTFPRTRGTVELVTPSLDVPLKNARWDLYLPPDYRYGDFEGTMQRELPAAVKKAAAPALSLYSLSDYAKMEQHKKIVRDQDIETSVSNARGNLSRQKLNEAYQYFNRARQKADRDDYARNEELEKLEVDLKRAQTLNFVQGQRDFVDQNAPQDAQRRAPQQQEQQPAIQMLFDEQAAEQQVTKVQAAQEVAVAKALPLRVNLPKRGLRYSFTQVLQTEIGKPMMVQFGAVQARTLGWPATLAVSAVGLAGLWALVAAVLARRQR